MLYEYYSIRIKDAEPGKGALHVTPHYDEVHSSIKHFKEKHPDKTIVAYKHELKKGPMGLAHKRKVMFGKDKPADKKDSVPTVGDHVKEDLDEMFADQGSGSSEKENKAWDKSFKKKLSLGRHKVMVTVSDPNHTSVSKRKETVMKRVNVTASSNIEAKAKAEDFYKKQGYKIHDVEYHSRLDESTKSFKTLMRSIEDKKSIKNLKVPSPAERRALEQPKQPEKLETVKESLKSDLKDWMPNVKEVAKKRALKQFKDMQKKKKEATKPIKEAVVPVDMGKTVHSVKHGEDEWTIHDMESPRSTSAFKVRKNGKLQGNFAGRMSAHAYLKSRTQNESVNESFTHMVHVQGNLDNPALEKHMRSSNGDYHQETEKGSSYKFKSAADAAKFQAGIKTTKDIYAGDVYRLNSNKG